MVIPIQYMNKQQKDSSNEENGAEQPNTLVTGIARSNEVNIFKAGMRRQLHVIQMARVINGASVSERSGASIKQDIVIASTKFTTMKNWTRELEKNMKRNGWLRDLLDWYTVPSDLVVHIPEEIEREEVWITFVHNLEVSIWK